jgi:membrane fusion protein, heavy metal efflux system
MTRIYIFFILMVMLGCKESAEPTQTDAVTTEYNGNIQISTAQFASENMVLGGLSEQVFFQSVKANGYIDVPPQNKAKVSTFMGGYVTQTPLLIGDEVKKGQLVVTLKNTEFVEIQQQFLEIAEQLTFLESEYQRQKTLFDENITSQKNYLKAESAFKTARASYNGLKQKLQLMNLSPDSVANGQFSSTINLYAPIAGKVTSVNVSNGSFVSPADVILEIANTEHIHLELSVFEKDILNLKKGQKIEFKIPEASDETFTAEVHLVGSTIDETNRTIKVHAHIEDEHTHHFVIGMFVEADILTHAKSGMALPTDAVKEQDGNYIAMTLVSKDEQGYQFETINLKIGVQNDAFVEVLNSDALSDKQVLIKGVFMAMGE